MNMTVIAPRRGAAPSARRDPRPRTCWIVVSLDRHHDARLRAVAARGVVTPHAIGIAGRNPFESLDVLHDQTLGYSRHALFPDRAWTEIDRDAMVAALRRRLDAIRPDVVFVNGWSEGGCVAALEWALENGAAAALMSDSAADDEPRRWWKEAIKKRLVRLASAGLVAGEPHAAYAESLGLPRDRLRDGYDVVDNDHFRRGADAARRGASALRARLGLPERYFIACARFVEKKNLARLLRAYALYRARAGAEAWGLTLIGGGALEGALRDLRAALGLEGSALMPGPVAYDELPAYYGLAGAFVHASTTEQWGLVVNEAMAAGLPIMLSKRCGCAADLIEPGRNGVLFDPYDVEDMANALAWTASDACDRRAMGIASREIVARWTPERFAASFEAVAKIALSAPRSTPRGLDRALFFLMRRR